MSEAERRLPELVDSKFRFLVLGAGRSGTSLLTALIDQHPDVEVGFEVGGHEYLRGQQLEEVPGRVFYDRAEAFINHNIEEAEKSHAAMWGNKIITEQLAGLNRHNLHCKPPLDTLSLFLDEYLAGLRIVYLLRDGRACVQSKLNRTAQDLEEACRKWRFAVKVYEHLQSRDNTLFLRYEELVVDPVATLARVFDFLEVSPFNDFEGATRSEKIPGQYHKAAVDAGRAGIFDHRHESVALIGEELRRCGYI